MNKVQLHEWKDYFMELLEEMEYTKQTKEEERKISMQVEEREVITEEEVRKQIKNLTNKENGS